jgi:hypothetical protein
MTPFSKLLISLVLALPFADGFTFVPPRGLAKVRLFVGHWTEEIAEFGSSRSNIFFTDSIVMLDLY